METHQPSVHSLRLRWATQDKDNRPSTTAGLGRSAPTPFSTPSKPLAIPWEPWEPARTRGYGQAIFGVMTRRPVKSSSSSIVTLDTIPRAVPLHNAAAQKSYQPDLRDQRGERRPRLPVRSYRQTLDRKHQDRRRLSMNVDWLLNSYVGQLVSLAVQGVEFHL